MDFHQLTIFTHVYKLNSFTKASAQLNISQPTISEHIKNLEAECDCRLFDRLGRGILPTPKARELYPKVLVVLDQMNALKAEFQSGEGQICGEMVIGASTIPATYILPELLSRFRKEYPQTTFVLQANDTAEVTAKVRNHELLLGVVGSKTDEENLDYFPMATDELVLVAAPALAKGWGKSKGLSDLPMIIREIGSGTRDTMLSLLAKNQIVEEDLDLVATLGSTASVKEAVKSGLGASFVSRMAVAEELKDGRLVELKVKGCRTGREFYVITHKRRSLPHHYQIFMEFIRAQIKS